MNFKQLPSYEGIHGEISYTDTYNDCTLMTVKETSKEAFDAYLTALVGAGYTEKSPLRRVLGTENKAAIYANGEYLVNLFYVANRNEAKATIEPLHGLDLSVFDPANATDGDVPCLLIQSGLDGVIKDGVLDLHDDPFWVGMSYVYRLSDGRFVIYDGGLFGEERNNVARLYKALKDNCTDPTGKITIAAWVFTHPHTDHMGAFMDFTKLYWNNPKYDVTIEKVICNLCNVETQTEKAPEGYDRSVTVAKIEGYDKRLQELRAAGVDVYKAHAGQMYYVGNMTIEVMFTFDLLTPDMLAPNRLAVLFDVEEGSAEDLQYQAFDAYAAEHGLDSIHRVKNGDGTVTYTYGDTVITAEENKPRDHWMRTYGEKDHGRTRYKYPGVENKIAFISYNKYDYTNVVSVVTRATLHIGSAEHTAIFTGDATYESLEWMNAQYGTAMKSDFIQIPHHGGGHFPRVKLGKVGEVTEEELKKHSYLVKIPRPNGEYWYDFYHEAQEDLFYGDNATKSQLLAELEEQGKTSRYVDYYTEDGYGYVRAKYVLWPACIRKGPYFDWVMNDPKGARRSILNPDLHLPVEVGEENCLVAGHTFTVIRFDGADVKIEANIPYGDLSEYNAF